MILLSHRGNTNGKQSELENMPEYIDSAIKLIRTNVKSRQTWIHSDKL